jgi:hypothetical protein
LLNPIIYKFFAILSWALCAIIGFVALRSGLELGNLGFIILKNYQRIEAYRLGEYTAMGFGILVGFVLAFFGARFLFQKGKWFWAYAELE